jgi:hypothetical protein
MNKHDKAILEDFFQRNNFTESERHDFLMNFGPRIVDDATLDYWWELRASNGRSHPGHSGRVGHNRGSVASQAEASLIAESKAVASSSPVP